MFGSSLIEVVIGLVFVFALMALLVTQTNTAITSAFNLRAKNLKKGLQDLITDKQLQAKMLSHPLIKMVDVSQPTQMLFTDQVADKIINAEVTEVNYIPPQTFVEALIGTLLEQSNITLFAELQDAINDMTNAIDKSEMRELLENLKSFFSEETLRKIYVRMDQIPDERIRKALLSGLTDLEATISALRHLGDGDLVALEHGIQQIRDPRLKSALRTVLTTAKNIDEANDKLVSWFNDGMGRASETFKKNLQRISLGVALTMTLVLNVDTLYLARTLWENPELRQNVAQAAAAFDTTAITIPSPSTPPTEDDAPAEETEGDTPSTETTVEDVLEQSRTAQETAQTLLELQLPISWEITPVTDDMIEQSLALGLPDPRNNPRNLWNFWPGNNGNWWSLLLEKIIGIGLTTLAAAQGAPFWFDLLKRLTTRG